ncbi:hypothetical protein D3C84_1263660 [compost metagenome]
MQVVDLRAEAEDLATGLEVADFDLAGDLVEAVFGQPIEGWEALQVVADFDQLDLHAGLLRAERALERRPSRPGWFVMAC